MITIQKESFMACVPELKPIFVVHANELCPYPDKMILDPDYDKYAAGEKAAALQFITVRSDGELVGYYVGMIAMSLHYKGVKVNINDIFYIKKEYRLLGVGDKLFNAVKEDNKKLGVKFWRLETKNWLPADKFMEKQGFEKKATVHTMWMGDQ